MEIDYYRKMQSHSISRRAFLSSLAPALIAGRLGAASSSTQIASLGVPVRQEPLAFPLAALEPFMKAETLRRHYYEVHATYLKELQAVLEAEEMAVGNVVSLMPGMERIVIPPKADSRMPLGKLVSMGLSSQGLQTLSPESTLSIRRAGGGHINHTAFWRFLSPPDSGPSGPGGGAARAIQEDFGSIKAFRQVFKEKAMEHGDAGWAWLVYRPDGCLVATTTSNEDNPLMKDHIPWQNAGRIVLALDLWEHSYYDQYKHDREAYIDAWWKVVNWRFVNRAYEIVSGKA